MGAIEYEVSNVSKENDVTITSYIMTESGGQVATEPMPYYSPTGEDKCKRIRPETLSFQVSTGEDGNPTIKHLSITGTSLKKKLFTYPNLTIEYPNGYKAPTWTLGMKREALKNHSGS